MKQYNHYSYDGPVMEFETCIERRWRATTYAVSEQKARSNLAFRYKQLSGRSPGSMITLPGKIRVMQSPGNKEAAV